MNQNEMKNVIVEIETALERLRAAVAKTAPEEKAECRTEKAPAENYFRAFSLIKGLY